MFFFLLLSLNYPGPLQTSEILIHTGTIVGCIVRWCESPVVQTTNDPKSYYSNPHLNHPITPSINFGEK